MAKFDLTCRIGQYLDRHLAFPLLEFLDTKRELKARRAEVVRELGTLQNNVSTVVGWMNDEKVMKKMEEMRDSKALNNYLVQDLEFKIEMMDGLVKLAKYRYECGNYSISTSYLYFYMLIMPPTDKDLVKVIQQESYTYRDPITEFLEHLYVNFDFDGARQKLQECQTVVFNDFFLIALLSEFVENARLMIFETFCRIHQCISISMLAEKLNMKADVAECWIVNLIRNARLDAKIDSKLGHVVMGGQPASPYQQLVEKIETLSVRSEALENLIERKLKAKNQDRVSIVWN
ncbi:hypothetical protein G9C98_005029 [Cotesia typhae]|uniref:PCI domain-containing protein n=1 Tax=Cotesia typhae TaxID=2053667 RepID=A0A8J5QTY2_9HYME|nr:hypothetical protein G9C98_005029 [Cotesia typhae]